MRKHFAAGLLALLLLLTACAPVPEESPRRPEITVTVVRGNHPYGPEELLLDDGFRSALEDRLDVTIVLEEVWDISLFDESVDISFTGGLITNDCYWMIAMASGFQLEKLSSDVELLEPQFGRMGSSTYGYVFSEPGQQGTEPVLVADMGKLRDAGLGQIPYTEEGVYSLLLTLSEACEVPLAVYGSPAGGGFGCLLGLYGLAPTGGREYYLEDGEIRFDKISDQAEQYLRFVSRLYSEGLIASDCVSMNEYACRNLFLSGKTALAMFPNGSCAADVVAEARGRGIDAVAVDIPAPEGSLRTDTYARPIGLISYDHPYTRELLQIYGAIQAELLKEERPEEELLCRASLFAPSAAGACYDPVEELMPELSTFYEKRLLDAAVIEPYYARLLTGSLPPEMGFGELQQKWLNPYAQIGEAARPLSGDNVMRIINGWYYKDQKEK